MQSEKRLGDFFRKRSEKGRPGLPLLSVTMNNGLVHRDTLERKTDTNLTDEDHLLIKKGDIAYNMMRMWQGASGLADRDGIVSPAYVVVAPKDGIDPLFASYWFKSPRMIYLFWAYSYGLTKDRLRLYFKDFAKVPAAPPALGEQKRIAAMLRSCDQAIDQMQRLIRAKRRLKQGLMQQLLTGHRRFPEFGRPAPAGAIPKDWKRVQVGDIARVRFSNVDKKTNGDEQPVRLCNYLDVYNNQYITADMTFMQATATPAEIEKYALHPGDVLITKDSETADDIANAAIVVDEMPGVICGYHLGILRPKRGVSGFFLGQLLMLPAIRYQFTRIANGVTRFGLGLSTVGKVPLWLPPYEEQEKVATVLMQVDREIECLSRSIGHLKQQKRGLMQKLLTGASEGK